MLTASLVAVWLVQAPPGWPGGAPTVTPQVREWNLAGAFVLKQEQFLVWQPVFDPNRPFQGWLVEAGFQSSLGVTTGAGVLSGSLEFS